MRVLFIQRSTGPGGSKNSLLQTLRVAQKHPEFQSRVLVGDDGSFVQECRSLEIEPVIAAIPEWRKWPERFFFTRRMNQIAERFREFAPEHVISNERWWSPHAQKLARRLGCRSACYVRESGLIAGPKAGQYRLHELDRVLCVSAAVQKELDRVASLPGNTRVVYNPVVPSRVEPIADAGIQLRLGKYPRAKKWLLHIGLISDLKNQIGTVQTLRCLHDAGLRDLGLILAGDSDTPYFPRVMEEIRRAGLEEFVCFTGHFEHIGNLIQLSETTLLASRHEGLPRAVIESFLLGKMCFATPLPGVEEIYGEQQKWFVSPEASPESLAQTFLAAQKRLSSIQEATEKIRQDLSVKFSPENHWRQLMAALT